MKRLFKKIASIALITAFTFSMIPGVGVKAASNKQTKALASYKSYLTKTAKKSSSNRTYGFYIMDLDNNGVPEMYCDTDKSDSIKLTTVLYKKGKNKKIYKSSDAVDSYYYSSSNKCIMSKQSSKKDTSTVITYVIYEYNKNTFKEVQTIVVTETNDTSTFTDGDGTALSIEEAHTLIEGYMVDAVAMDFTKNTKKHRKNDIVINVASTMDGTLEFISLESESEE